MPTISHIIKEKAPLILAEIKKSKSILLHMHPVPDPDSAGSALAMKFALEHMGKSVTLIQGDTEFTEAFAHFPGSEAIVHKAFLDMDLSAFDLFLILDSGSKSMITRRGEVSFPPGLKTIVIDHHRTNENFGEINLVADESPATAEILFDLFKEWDVKLDENISTDLFMGLFTDTGGFKYSGVSTHTFEVAAELRRHAPNISQTIARMENSNTPGFITFEAMCLESIKVYYGVMAIAAISHEALKHKNIANEDIRASEVSAFLRTVKGWKIAACAVEGEPGKTKFSFRSQDGEKWNVSALTESLGGGGHKAAAGLILMKPLEEALALVVARAKELYNL